MRFEGDSMTNSKEKEESIRPFLDGDTKTQDEGLWKEIEIPIIKLNEHNIVEDVNDACYGKFSIDESQIPIHQFLKDYPFQEKICNLVYQARQENRSLENIFENEHFLLKCKVVHMNRNDVVFVFLYDYSLQKQYEQLQAFHEQMKAVSHVSASVAHELRNPLSVIIGFLQLAKLTDKFSLYYDTILSELNRMNSIIENFLSVSRKKTERETQSPEEIMKSLVEIINPECLLHNVTFTYQFSKTEKKVNVNVANIKQVMLNLLRNSIEAYSDSVEKRFHIESWSTSNEYVIQVEDNGVGIPSDVIEQLGEPFFTTKKQGTGVGIPLCKKIIEEHDGTFFIESKVNKGTKITITLPFHS